MLQEVTVGLKLLADFRGRILRAGKKRAALAYEAYRKPDRVSSWTHRIIEWLDDPDYLLYLGVLAVNS